LQKLQYKSQPSFSIRPVGFVLISRVDCTADVFPTVIPAGQQQFLSAYFFNCWKLKDDQQVGGIGISSAEQKYM
jgi:hypothetical protein